MAQDTRAPGRAQRAPQAPQLARVVSRSQVDRSVSQWASSGQRQAAVLIEVGACVGPPGLSVEAPPGITIPPVPISPAPDPFSPPSSEGSYRVFALQPNAKTQADARVMTPTRARARGHQGSGGDSVSPSLRSILDAESSWNETPQYGHHILMDIMDSLILLLKPFNQSLDLLPQNRPVFHAAGGLVFLLSMDIPDNLHNQSHLFMEILEFYPLLTA